MLILAFSGVQGAGKDAAAEYLQSITGAAHLKYANAVRDHVALLLGIFDYSGFMSHRKLFDDREWKENRTFRVGDSAYTPRRLMQLIATDCFRQMIDRNVWADQVAKEIERLEGMTRRLDVHDKFAGIAVISDLRYPSELHRLVSPTNRVFVIFITADGLTCTDTHDSEKYLEDLKAVSDFQIHNDFTPEFFNKVEETYKTILKYYE